MVSPAFLRERKVRGEILDTLPHDHPDALANRRDMRRLNFLMGNVRWFARQLRSLPPGSRVLELAGGDGCLVRSLDRLLNLSSMGLSYRIIDLAPERSGLPREVQWIQADLLEFREFEEYEMIMGNHILHQFQPEALRLLGTRIQSARHLAFSEPLRATLPWVLFQVFCCPWLNRVSRHDGRVSIEAGFRGDELIEQLGLKEADRVFRVDRTWLGAYRLVSTLRDHEKD